MKIGYAHISTGEQSLALQRDALTAEGYRVPMFLRTEGSRESPCAVPVLKRGARRSETGTYSLSEKLIT